GLLCSFQVCFVCGERGATITCQEVGCDRRFHLPCAVEGGCVTHYLVPYSSFCWEHRPQQQELAAPEDINCIICMDPVEGRTTYGTKVCPACKRAWFHRACIQVGAVHLLRAQQALSSTRASLTLFLFLLQGLAMCAGAFSLQCPLCQNTRLFLTEMFFMGIRIPVRLVSSWPALRHAWTCPRSYAPCRSWKRGVGGRAGRPCICLMLWQQGLIKFPFSIRQASRGDSNACAELYQRHRSCDARECLCPGGRGVAEPDGPWQLFLCSSCAAVGTHRRCSNLGNSHEARWECDSHAGLGSSSSARSELAGPSTTGPAASGQSPRSLELEFSSPSTRSQAASEQTRRWSTTRQQPSVASRGSAPLQRSRGNGPSEPMRV
ncbi:G2/M phase-specific E3 ubiquitin-protein ligase-like, partial [Pezoporus occidentalis]|uniref:G2/M phase-specific E3 ubiquitin-protein ligase-like n=1 Tax=Pezoporus occidentalis TaxID=407982 RepID=UPI002F9121BB